MRDADLAYLAELVRRDGDKDMQGFFGIESAKLYGELRSLANIVHERHYGTVLTRLPITTTMDCFATRKNLDYKPWR